MRNKNAVPTAAMATALSFVVSMPGNVHAAPTPAIEVMEVMPHSAFPRMSILPQSHLVAAYHLTQSGQTLYADTRGKVIGRTDPRTRVVIWSGNGPYSALRTDRPGGSPSLIPRPGHNPR
ncbi:MAG: hypothetical protein JO250_19080 [Armatimonadetes bacterium]|nr:hypothetical protein [Armatimonadota bacterium]